MREEESLKEREEIRKRVRAKVLAVREWCFEVCLSIDTDKVGDARKQAEHLSNMVEDIEDDLFVLEEGEEAQDDTPPHWGGVRQ